MSAGPIRPLVSSEEERRHAQREGADPGEPRLPAEGHRGPPEPQTLGEAAGASPEVGAPRPCGLGFRPRNGGQRDQGHPVFSSVSGASRSSRTAGFRKSGVPSPLRGPIHGVPRAGQRGPLRLVARCGAEDTCRAVGWHTASVPGQAGEPEV